ncbi:MAG: trypsin-like serine protease [Streptosporangiaceae bacterium]
MLRYPSGLRWLSARGGFMALTGLIALTTAVAPATGAATGVITKVRHLINRVTDASATGQSFTGTAAIGALFTTSDGKLRTHFCSASVVNSPAGDLVLTAAHCVTNLAGAIVFVPDYHDGTSPYGVWTVTHVYTDSAWQSSENPDDDFAFITVSDPSEGAPIEDITGAEELGTSPATPAPVQVIGYPDGASEPVECTNWTKIFSSAQLQFDCGGYPDGTSGGPFLTDVSAATGQGVIIGLIGGYEQGGLTPSVSYSAMLGATAQALYKTATLGG